MAACKTSLTASRTKATKVTKVTKNLFWVFFVAFVGFVFFEGIIGLSGDRLDLPEWVLPAALIGFGIIVLLWSLTGRRLPTDSDRYQG